MKTIWKFPLVIFDEQTVSIPEVYEWLDVQVQESRPVLWARVDPASRVTAVKICMLMTGKPAGAAEGMQYIGTCQIINIWDRYVVHVFGTPDRRPHEWL